MSLLLAPLIGLVIGLSLALLGGGGSILTVPALVYFLGQDAHTAVASSLVIVGINAFAGAGLHWRNGHVRLQEALLFGLSGIVTAYSAARLSRQLPEAVLLVLFALLMITVAGLMLRQNSPASTDSASRLAWWKVFGGGSMVGFLTGLLGVGGGFLIVPALVLLLKMNIRDAVGSSLVVITLNSIAGFAGHLTADTLNWSLISLLLGGGVAGIAAGVWFVPRIPAARIRRSFALFVALLGAALLLANLPTLLA